MAKYCITYNAYKDKDNNRTIVVKNDTQLLQNSSLCKYLNNNRLQSWFDETTNWPGLGQAIDEDNNEAECEIWFRGREVDFSDLQDYFYNIYKSESGTRFTVRSEKLSTDEDVLVRLDKLIDEAREKRLLSDDKIQEMENNLSALKTSPFTISVIAIMSSGKSTLLNALMHKDLLPTGDEATTANVVEICDNDSEIIRYETYDSIDDNANQIGEGVASDSSIFREINANKSVKRVKIYTDIPMVSVGKMPLMLRDTPGPDTTDDDSHSRITYKIINEKLSTVLYVMNSARLRVESDKELLEAISEQMKIGGKEANDRFLFVVTRVDDWVKNKNQTLEGLVERTRAYLKEFHIDNPRLFLVTSALVCEIWRNRSGAEFEDDEEGQFDLDIRNFSNEKSAKRKFDEFADTSIYVKKELFNDLETARSDNDNLEIAYIHSGIKGLEYSIKEYMEKYAYPIRVSEVVRNIIDTIDEETMRSQFQKAIEADEKTQAKAEKKIEAARKKQKEREAKKEEFEKKIKEYGDLGNLRKKANELVNEKFRSLVDSYEWRVRSWDKLQQEVAVEIIDELKKKVRKNEEDLDHLVKTMIREEIFEKGTAIIEEYKSFIEQFEKEFDLGEGFDIVRVKHLKGLKEVSFDDISRATENVSDSEKKYKETTKMVKVKNPSFRRFLFWSWGGDEYIEKEEKTQTFDRVINYVDKKTIQKKIAVILVNANKNVDEMIEQTSEVIKGFRSYMVCQMENYNFGIDKTVEEYEKYLKQAKKHERSKEYHEKQIVALKEYMDRVNSLVEV